MNRGVVQNSPVQQMMGGNPNWWAIAAPLPPSRHHHHHHPNSPFTLPTQHHHHHNNLNFVPPHSSPFPFSPPSNYNLPLSCSINDNQEDHITPDSWSHQLPVSGLVGEEERSAAMEQLVKQENYNPSTSQGIVYQNNEDFQDPPKSNNHNNNSFWSPHHNTKFTASTNSTTTTAAASSSPQSCVTNNLFEFSSTNAKFDHQLKSECNSSAVKKAKFQTSATQSTFKVRKFGDRITILHQIVSPFGKTDTASVLLEAIGYIRFLQSQIEALSHPYLSSGSGNNKKQQQHPHSVQGERKGKFPEDPGQLLNGNRLKRKGGPDQEEPKDLRSRGLCLVPVSSTLNVGRDNGADYWAATLGDFQ